MNEDKGSPEGHGTGHFQEGQGISVPGSASMGPINISFPHVDSAYQHLC